MLVPCKFRGDHLTNRSRPHGRSQCPPAPGKHGDRYRSLHAKRETRIVGKSYDVRGVSVAGVGGNQAKSHRAGKKAAKTVKGLKIS